jgi:ATP-binding cassette subfamily B protein
MAEASTVGRWTQAAAPDERPLERPTWQQRWAALANIPPAFRLLLAASPALTSLLILVRAASALLPFASLLVSKKIVDLVVGVTERHVPIAAGGLWLLLGIGLALAVLALGLSRSTDYLESRVADEFSRAVSLRILGHAAALDLASLEDPAFYDRLERARVQATDRAALLTALGSTLQRTVSLLSLVISVAYFSPWLLVLLLASTAPALVSESEFALHGYALAHRLTPIRRQLDYLLLLGSSRESAKEVRMFGLAEHLRDRFARASDELIRANRSLTKRRLLWSTVFAAIGAAGYYGGYGYVVWQAVRGQITVGTLTFLGGAIAAAQVELQTVFSLFSEISQQALYLSDLFGFLDMQPRVLPPASPKPIRERVEHGLEFRDVSFKYADGAGVLEHLTFTIRPGEHVALVGENGAGKTTVVKLMTRLYDPTAGQILLDGVDVREYEPEELRRHIAVIFQDFFRYDLTVRENVGVGRVDRLADDAALWAAIGQSGIEDVVRRLPSGLEQMLGERFRGGVDLSGGQWQSIALARAYLRSAQLLILDEPTAALDPRAEAEVFTNVATLMKGRMALLISHRFSTVRMAERILLLHDGTITENGTHEDLVRSGGEYARLFELQAANYR